VKLASVIALAACGSGGQAPPASKLVVGVDRRVELMSIVFRLAGRPRYAEAATPYARAVDARFARDHRAVVFTSQLGVGYEMAPLLAVHLDDHLQPVRPLEPLPPQLERWKVAKLPVYLDAVRDFAGALDAFLTEQRDYIARVEAADRAAFGKVPLVDWYDRVFGPRPRARYHLVPGLLTGPMDYAARVELPDGSEDIYIVAHLDHPDADGVPAPTAAALPFVAHELCHSYTNPIVDGALAELQPIAAPAIAKVADRMRAQAYTTDAIVIEESVVRAMVVLWLRDLAGAAAGDAEITAPARLGFVWTRALADALAAARGTSTLTPAAVVAATRETFAHASAP
jgi:hypothetical protein